MQRNVGRALLLVVVSLVLSGCIVLRCDVSGCFKYLCDEGGCGVVQIPARNCTEGGPAGPYPVARGACVKVDNPCGGNFEEDDLFEFPERPPGLHVEADNDPPERFICAAPDVPLGSRELAFNYIPIQVSQTGTSAQPGFGQLEVVVFDPAGGPGPDLVVSQLTAPASFAPGDTITVTVSVTNVGGVAVDVDTEVDLFLMEEDRFPFRFADPRLDSFSVPALGPGETITVTRSVAIHPLTEDGRFIVALADAGSGVTERDEANNTRAVAIVLRRPDLVVSTLVGPTTARRGETISVDETTTNQGDEMAGSSLTSFFLATTASIGSAVASLGERTAPPLPSGNSSVGTTLLAIPPQTVPGEYFVVAVADDRRDVVESDENNNTRARPITIVPARAPMTATASATPATIAAGQGAELTVVVTGGVTPFTFAWSPAEGLNSTTVPSPLASPGVSTTYTVAITDAEGVQTSAQVTVTVVPVSADLSLAKSGSPGTVGAGDVLTYSLTVRNDGPSPAPAVLVTDTLPAAARFVSASPDCLESGGVVRCSLGTLASAAERSVSIVVTPRLPADLAITRLEVSPDTPVVVGGQLTYTIEVTNFGPESASDVRLVTLAGGFDASGTATGPPLDVTLQSAAASPGGSCAAVGGGGSGPVQCELGTLNPGARAIVTVVVTTNTATTAVGVAPGSLVNTARVTTATATVAADDPDSTNDQDSVASVVLPASGSDLAITRFEVSPPNPVVVDDELTYTIEVTNFGPDAAPDVVLTTLSAGFDPATGAASGPPLPVALFSATASPAGSCADAGGIGAGPVQCTLGALASGASATVTVVVKTQSPTTVGGAPGGALVNGALVTRAAAVGGATDADRRNDGGSVATVVVPLTGSDLAVTRLEVSPATPVVVGDTLAYTIEVTNFGPDAVAAAQLTTLVSGFDAGGAAAGPPPALALVSSAVSTGGTCADPGGDGLGPVQCALGPLARGARATVTLLTTATAATTAVGAPGFLTNAARVTATGGPADANPGNDAASVDSSVLSAAPASLVNTASVISEVADPDGNDNTATATTVLRPSLRVTALVVPTVVAAGESAQLSAAVAGGVPPYAFTWSPVSGLSSAAIANPVAAPAVTTAYIVTVTDAVGTRASAPVTLSVESAVASVVTIVATDPAAAESGPDTGAFTVSRTGSTAAALTVSLTVSGTALSGVDYQPLGTSVVIPTGAASVSIPIAPVADGATEGSETVVLTVVPGPGYVVGAPASATVAIEDADETVLTVVATDSEAREPEPGLPPNPAVFTITRTGSTAASLVVRFTLGGTASLLDYEGFFPIFLIPAGQRSVAVSIVPLADPFVEGPKTVTVTLFPDPAYRIGTPGAATATIQDNAAVVTVTAPDAAATEPEPGVALDAGTITFTRANNLGVPLVVLYTVSGTATPGADYASIPLAVEIPTGQASVSIPITPLADALAEGPETVTVTLTPDPAYVLGAADTATVTIADTAAVVTVLATDPSAEEAPLNPGAFTLTRAGNLGVAVAVQFTLDGSAINGVDYEALAPVATIAAGETSVTVVITPLQDGVSEGPETVVLTVSPDPGYVVGPPGTATVVILPDS